LKAAGIRSLDELLAKPVEELAAVEAIGEKKATQLKHDAENYKKEKDERAVKES
jgi:DNA repair protein RadC